MVEVVDPITLGAKLVDVRDRKSCCCDDDFDLASVPASVCRVFDDQFVTGNEAKRVFVSLGIFSIIKIERHVQLLIPSYDFCIPQKECVGATDDNPCDLFERIDFPVDEFFPPERANSWNVIKMTYPSRKMTVTVDVEDKSVQKPPVIMQEVLLYYEKTDSSEVQCSFSDEK